MFTYVTKGEHLVLSTEMANLVRPSYKNESVLMHQKDLAVLKGPFPSFVKAIHSSEDRLSLVQRTFCTINLNSTHPSIRHI